MNVSAVQNAQSAREQMISAVKHYRNAIDPTHGIKHELMYHVPMLAAFSVLATIAVNAAQNHKHDEAAHKHQSTMQSLLYSLFQSIFSPFWGEPDPHTQAVMQPSSSISLTNYFHIGLPVLLTGLSSFGLAKLLQKHCTAFARARMKSDYTPTKEEHQKLLHAIDHEIEQFFATNGEAKGKYISQTIYNSTISKILCTLGLEIVAWNALYYIVSAWNSMWHNDKSATVSA